MTTDAILPRPLEGLAAGGDGADAHDPGLDAGDRRGDDPGDRLQAQAPRSIRLDQEHGAGPIVDPRAVAGRDRAALAERGPELREGVIYSLPCEGFVSRVSVPSEAELQKFFDQNSFRFIQWQMKDDKGHSSGKEPKAPVLSEHRDETIKLYKQAKAARMAADMVDTLVGKLYADKIAPDSAAWSQMLNAAGLKKTSIKTEDALADETSLQALSALSLNGRSFSGALQTESDGRFILLTKVTPAHSQEYSAVSQRVKADALDAKRQSEDFKILTAKVDSLKKSFKSGQLDAEASKAGFEVINPDHFTVNEPAKIVSSSELLQSLVKAKVGDILSAVDSTKAVVIALQERRIPPFNPQGAKAQEVRKQLGAFYKELSELSYLNEYARVYAK